MRCKYAQILHLPFPWPIIWDVTINYLFGMLGRTRTTTMSLPPWKIVIWMFVHIYLVVCGHHPLPETDDFVYRDNKHESNVCDISMWQGKLHIRHWCHSCVYNVTTVWPRYTPLKEAIWLIVRTLTHDVFLWWLWYAEWCPITWVVGPWVTWYHKSRASSGMFGQWPSKVVLAECI
jgi:hypothetical protein